jgi:hypothetical protein
MRAKAQIDFKLTCIVFDGISVVYLVVNTMLWLPKKDVGAYVYSSEKRIPSKY